MSHLVVSGVAKAYGGTAILKDIHFDLNPGERVALVGENGAGKTTLLQILAGLSEPDRGSVVHRGRVRYLEQRSIFAGAPVRDAVMPDPLCHAGCALEQAEQALENPTDEALQAFAEAEEHYRVLGGYTFASQAEKVLTGLELDPDASVSRLSGGEARRVLLARLLLEPAEFYLLDEPTNHLDSESVRWLEQWILSSPAGFLIASHDRAFLDTVATRVLQLERTELYAYSGNYTEAMTEKRVLRAAQERDFAAHQRKVQQLESDLGRLRSRSRSANQFNHMRADGQSTMGVKTKASWASATLARRAKAIETRLERMEAPDKPYVDRTRLGVDIGEVSHGPNEVLTLEDVQVGRGDFRLGSVSVHIRRGERVALMGANGSGKSTLLAAILGRLPAGGKVTFGRGLEHFWAGQKGEELDAYVTLQDALLGAQPNLTRGDLYPLLASVGLPTDPEQRVAALSGGERTRLALARLGVTRAHLLILDEPTNHLDIRAIEMLEALLQNYPGTLLFTSHDRYLVARVATMRLRLRAGVLVDDLEDTA